MTPPRRLALASLPALLLVSAVEAGQVRINVSSNVFTPVSAQLNVGDHAVWVWTGGIHSTTSGDGATQTEDGQFDSGVAAGRRFSWMANLPARTQEYFCFPHAPAMTGFLQITTGVAVSNFRITEVDFEAPGGQDNIVITNLSTASGNLGQYRVSVQAGSPLLVAPIDLIVPPGQKVTLHLNQSGSNTQTDLFLPGVTLGSSGSVGLYVPNTVNVSLALVDQMIDFVQWGAGGQLNETTANGAAFWTPGEFAPAVAQGHSIQFCGTATQHGSTFWKGLPTPGSPDCATPVTTGSWGRIKTLYR